MTEAELDTWARLAEEGHWDEPLPAVLRLVREVRRLRGRDRLVAEALEVAAGMVVRSPRDFTKDHRDAWLWGLLVGWDHDALEALVELGQVQPGDVGRLLRLHEALLDVRLNR